MGLIERTRVFKSNGCWWVNYTLPHSGQLMQNFKTWQQAWNEAVQVELERPWH